MLLAERIKAWRVMVADGASATLTAQLVSRANSTGGITTVGGSDASDNSTSDQVLTITGLTTTVAAGTSYHVRIAQSGAGTATIAWVEIDYDRVTS